jgi:ubiquinone/menaquinone biosynthesis C-methylase UbiE
MTPKKKPSTKTSWGGVAAWYGEHLAGEDTYHEKVVLPNLLRVLNLKKGERVLDLACGEGYFARAFAKAGATVVGADIAKELIEKARLQGGAEYHVALANDLKFAKDKSFDTVVCVLALQNIEDLTGTFAEARRVLRPGGRFVMVLNHPAFRVLKRSSWGWDEAAKAQYRRIDGYLSGAKVAVDMAPGGSKKAQTVSYHRSLQDFFKPLAATGFAVVRLEEWISHKTSQRGPRQRAEDTARKEIPLFMLLEARVS